MGKKLKPSAPDSFASSPSPLFIGPAANLARGRAPAPVPLAAASPALCPGEC